MDLNALLNTSFNKIDSLYTKNKPSFPPLNHSRLPNTDKQNLNGNTTIPNDNQGPVPSFLHNTTSDKNNTAKGHFITLQEQNMHSEDIDFWLVFSNQDIPSNAKNLMDLLRNQLESINILKVKQAYYLQRGGEGTTTVTGWKLYDQSVSAEVTKRTKELMLNFNNKRIKYEVIGSTEELRKYLRRYELDQKLNQVDLFRNEYALPLFKLHIQGLFYYEFDYVDICPETICVVCGLPPHMNNAELKAHLKESGLPEPLNILRNPLEGDSCVRFTFGSREEAEIFRYRRFKVPISGPFTDKPVIIMPMKDRSFDYFSQLNKYQVMVDFEANEDQNLRSKLEVLKTMQENYGLVCDVNILYSQLWVVTFVSSDSATRCLDHSKLDHFRLQVTISQPSASYMLTGNLFQSDTTMTRNTNLPSRPPPLLRVDPNQLKIKTEYFEKNQNLKRRYQKVYLRQRETFNTETNQLIAEFFSNDAQPPKERLEPLIDELKDLEPKITILTQEEEKALEKTMELENKTPIAPFIEPKIIRVPIAETMTNQTEEKEIPLPKPLKKKGRKPEKTKKIEQVKPPVKPKESVEVEDTLLKKRRLSPMDTDDISGDKVIEKIVETPQTSYFQATPLDKPRARKGVTRNLDDIPIRENKMAEEEKIEAEAEVPKAAETGSENKMTEETEEVVVKQEDMVKQEEEASPKKGNAAQVKTGKVEKIKKDSIAEREQHMIQQNIEKIKHLIVSHQDIRRRKTVKNEDVKVKQEEAEKKARKIAKPKSRQVSKSQSKPQSKPRSNSRKQK